MIAPNTPVAITKDAVRKARRPVLGRPMAIGEVTDFGASEATI